MRHSSVTSKQSSRLLATLACPCDGRTGQSVSRSISHLGATGRKAHQRKSYCKSALSTDRMYVKLENSILGIYGLKETDTPWVE